MITRIEPGPGQESVWDYPRPPRLEATSRHIRIIFNGVEIANTRRAFRVLETSHPPGYYLPPADIQMQYLRRTPRGSLCEWKGQAIYYTLTLGERAAEDVAWGYPRPAPAFAAIAGYLAFYAGPMDACYVDDELVMPQPGEFYGGWITADVVGPFKGGPGSRGW
jgi:uncharacterized protein (DUF427 family)